MTTQQWNQEYSVGQAVRLKETGGSVFITTTKTQAFDRGAGEPVIVLHGREGVFPLVRVKALVTGYGHNSIHMSLS